VPPFPAATLAAQSSWLFVSRRFGDSAMAVWVGLLKPCSVPACTCLYLGAGVPGWWWWGEWRRWAVGRRGVRFAVAKRDLCKERKVERVR
jgi:hypothetical protein